MSPTATRPRVRSGAGSSAAPGDDQRFDRGPSELERHRRDRRRRLRLMLLIPLLVLVLVIAGIWVVGFSSALALRTVQVRGLDTVSESQVLAAAQAPIGTPMARIDLAAITARVDSLRQVESAEVDRSWPHGLTITVHERRPAFAIGSQGTYLLVDHLGVGYRLIQSRPSDLVLADVDSADQPLLAETASVVAVLPASIRSQLISVDVPTRDSVTLRLTKNRTVNWGDDSRPEDKLRVLTALLEHSHRGYDVSAPDEPAVRG